MNRNNWEKEFEGEMYLENDANDFYFEWVQLDSEEGNLNQICYKWLALNQKPKKFKIKVFNGALFIQRIDD